LALFGFYRAAHVDFIEKGNIAFKHLYVDGWDASYETMPYPPATGVFAIYTIPQFYKSVDYALTRVSGIPLVNDCDINQNKVFNY